MLFYDFSIFSFIFDDFQKFYEKWQPSFNLQ